MYRSLENVEQTVPTGGNIKRRHKPSTLLETLSSTQTYLSLFFPVALSILVLLITSSFRESSYLISPQLPCPSKFRCDFTARKNDFLFSIPTVPIQKLKYLKLSLMIDGSLPSNYIPHDSLVVVEIGIFRSGEDSFNSHPVMKKSVKWSLLGEDDPIRSGDINLSTIAELSLISNQTIKIPLSYTSFESPGIITESVRFPALNISFPGILENNIIGILVSSQSDFSSIITSFVQLALMLTCFVIACLSIKRLAFATRPPTTSSIHSTNSESAGTSSRTLCSKLYHVLPEQLNGIGMMIQLFFWLEPLSFVENAVITSRGSISPNTLLLFRLIPSICQHGLLFSMLVFIDGLCCAPGSRQELEILRDTLNLNDSRGKDTKNREIHSTGKSDCNRSYTDNNSAEQNYSSQNPFLPPPTESIKERFAAYDWVNPNKDHRYQSQHKQRFGSSSAQTFPFSSSSSSYPRVHAQMRNMSIHHPCSPFFIDFIWTKLIFFLSCCLLSSLFWISKFPSIYGVSDEANQDDKRFPIILSFVINLFLTMTTAVWVFLIVKSMWKTNKALRKTAYWVSRFRQLAYQLLLEQLLLGLFFLSFTVYLQIISLSNFIKNGSLSIREILEASVDLLVYGFGPWSQGGARACIFVFVSGIFFTISVLLMSPLSNRSNSTTGSKVNDADYIDMQGTSHNFVALERHQPKWMREGQVLQSKLSEGKRKYKFISRTKFADGLKRMKYEAAVKRKREMFCLETACILLEVSCHSYFGGIGNGERESDEKAVNAQSPTRPFASSSLSSPFAFPTPIFHFERLSSFWSPTKNNESNSEYHEVEKQDVVDHSSHSATKTPAIALEDLENQGEFIKSDLNSATKLRKQHQKHLDLSQTGMKVVDTFENVESSTFGLICSDENSHDRLVVAFRGSISENTQSNLKFALIELPPLDLNFEELWNIAQNHSTLHSMSKSPPPLVMSPMNLASHRSSKMNSSKQGSDLSEGSNPSDPNSRLNSFSLDLEGVSPIKLSATDLTYPNLQVPHSESQKSASPYSEEDISNNEYFNSSSTPTSSRSPSPNNKSTSGRLENTTPLHFDMHALLVSPDTSQGIQIGLKDRAKENERKDSWVQLQRFFTYIISSTPVFQHALPRVHAGFWYAYKSVRNQFLASLIHSICKYRAQLYDELMQRQTTTSDYIQNNHSSFEAMKASLPDIPTLRIYFTGHSLGGALSSIAAIDVSTNMDAIIDMCDKIICWERDSSGTSLPETNSFHSSMKNLSSIPHPAIRIYTFGSPKVGNKSFAQSLDKKVKCCYRVEQDGDIVTLLPPSGWYSHAGIQVVISAEGDECGSGTVVVKPSFVESYLLRRQTGNIQAHSLHEYRDTLEACFSSEELNEYLKSRGRTTGDKSLQSLPDWLIKRTSSSHITW